MRRDADVVVVGAGPAGSSLAARLAGRGARVLLLDERTFPRSKPCGDCVSPGARPLLEELGVASDLDRSGAAALQGWRIRTPGGRWFEGRFGEDGRGLPLTGPALPRRELDALLLSVAAGAGARIREGVRVLDLVREGGRVSGVRVRDRTGREETLTAGLVAGADGLRSTVARRLGGVRRGPRDRLAIVARYADGPEPEDRPAGAMRVSAEGCLGMAPLGGGRWNVTVVVPRSRARMIAADREGFLDGRLASYGVAERLAGARRMGEIEITGPFETSPVRTTAPGALLVGDAAGYFDPFTGQGIFRALAGARLAAACVLEVLGTPGSAGPGCGGPAETAALRRYESELARLCGPSRRVQRLIDVVLARRALLEPAARLLARAPGLADLLVGVAGDLEPAGALVDPRRLAGAVAGLRSAPSGRARIPGVDGAARPEGRECEDPPEREASCTPTTRSWSGRPSRRASSWRPTSRRGRGSSATIAG